MQNIKEYKKKIDQRLSKRKQSAIKTFTKDVTRTNLDNDYYYYYYNDDDDDDELFLQYG